MSNITISIYSNILVMVTKCLLKYSWNNISSEVCIRMKYHKKFEHNIERKDSISVFKFKYKYNILNDIY